MNSFMPTIISPFKYWVQSVLPQVYDDSLSYQELLQKVVTKLNEVISSQNGLSSELQKFLDQFGNNLNLVVDAIFQQWKTDGTWDTLINQRVLGEINTKVDDIQTQVNNLPKKTYVNIADYPGTFNQKWQAAYNAVAAHGTIFIPNGQYTLTAVISIEKPITVLGEYSGYDLEENTTSTTVAVYSTPLITCNINNPIYIKSIGVSIKNINVVSTFQSATDTVSVLKMSLVDVSSNTLNLRDIHIENCSFRGAHAAYVIWIPENILVSSFKNVWTWNGVVGFKLGHLGMTSTSLVFENCWPRNFTGTGFSIQVCTYSTLIGCAADSENTENSYQFASCSNVSLVSCGAEKSTKASIVIDTCNSMNIQLTSALASSVDNSQGNFYLRNSNNIVLLCCSDNTATADTLSLYTQGSTFKMISCNNFNKINDNGTVTTCGPDYCSAKLYSITATGATMIQTLQFSSGLTQMIAIQFSPTATRPVITLSGYKGSKKYVFANNALGTLDTSGQITFASDLVIGNTQSFILPVS